jgi:hypothetical protein
MPLGRINPRWCIPLTLVVFATDYLSGPDPTFPVLYCLAVFAAAWYVSAAASIVMAAIAPIFRIILLATLWHQADLFPVFTTLARAVCVGVVALWIARFADHERAMQRHVETLEGLLPICAFCKSIRNDAGTWEKLETYISDRSEAQFSHGFCPDCQREHYPEFAPVASAKD